MSRQFTVKELLVSVESIETRSAWSRGVKNYAHMILDNLDDYDKIITKDELNILLNGARNWTEYSWGGCALIYNEDISKMLCSPSELKKTKNGMLKPNKTEEWLDAQARALYQAYLIIEKIVKGIK